jgi:hypothetical protein
VNNNEHQQELRKLSLQIVLDLATLPRGDALTVLTLAHGLADRFLYSIPGHNVPPLDAFEDFTATCRGRS